MTAPATVENWREYAACRGRPEVADAFFPRTYGNERPEVQNAKRVCRHCPVRRDCLAYALDRESRMGEVHRHGIFGGLTPRERRELAEGKR